MQNNNKIDCLLKTDGATKQSVEYSKKYKNTKAKMREICEVFNEQSNVYNPKKTISIVESYLKETDKLERLLYSEISNYIFGLTSEDRGKFLTNVEKTLLEVIEGEGYNMDVKKVIIKIYDHVQLATHQIENANNIFNNSIIDAKSNLHDEIKSIEKEYITILGIFASIVLTFVGGITFTTSVLQNIDKTSIYRLIFIISLIAIVLYNTLYLLIKFLLKINDKNDNIEHKNYINWLLIIILLLVFIAWYININDVKIFSK